LPKFRAIVEPTHPFTAEDGQARLRIRLDCGGYLTLADHGIELKFRRLPGGNRIIDLREEVCDGDSGNDP